MLGLSTGQAKVLFDPARSKAGATLCAQRRPRRAGDIGAVAVLNLPVVNPFSLPLFRVRLPSCVGSCAA